MYRADERFEKVLLNKLGILAAEELEVWQPLVRGPREVGETRGSCSSALFS